MNARSETAAFPEDVPSLLFKTKFAFGIGSAAESIALYALGSYALLFYNQVVGLPAWMAGLAVSISLVADGLADPVIGSLSDRTRSTWGRRHPYMFAAPIPIALFFVAIFNPPDGMSDVLTFVWFALSVAGLRVSMACFHTPHLALGGELSSSYVERSRVMSWNNFALWFGGTAITLISLNVFFRTTPEYPLGLLNPDAYLPFSLLAACLTMIILFCSAWFTRDQIPHLPQPPLDQPGFSVLEFFRDVRKVLANRNYLWLLIALFSLSVTAGVRDSLLLYVNVYFWGFSTEAVSLFTIGSFIGYLLGFVFTARLHAIWGKRRVMVWSAVGNAFFPALGIMLYFAGLMVPKGDPWLLPVLIAISVGTWATSAALNISAMSALADIADENEVRYGIRQEGILYSTRAVFAKLDYAIGTAIAGGVLTLIAFPTKADPGRIDPLVVDQLGYVFGPIAMIPALIAAIFYAQYNISEQHHAETRRLLAEAKSRRGESAAEF